MKQKLKDPVTERVVDRSGDRAKRWGLKREEIVPVTLLPERRKVSSFRTPLAASAECFFGFF